MRSCEACQKSKVYRHVESPNSSIKMPASRFATVHVDLYGLFPESQGFLCLLVFIDRFTRFILVYPLRNLKTESVIIGINSFISTFGHLQHLQVSNGVQWTSKLFWDYCKFLGCDLCISNTRYPESSGLVERAIKNTKLALTVKLDRENWTFYAGTIVLSNNTMFCEKLGCSSAEFVFFSSSAPSRRFTYCGFIDSDANFGRLNSTTQHFATTLCPVPMQVEQSKTVYVPRELKTCTHIFVKQDPIKPDLTPVYSVPFLVVYCTDKTFCILSNDRVISVTVNNVNPCFRLKNSAEISHDSTVFDYSSNGN